MSTMFVEGFSHYGTQSGGTGSGFANMLNGVWAQLPDASGAASLSTPTWADADEGYWLGASNNLNPARVVLSSAQAVLFVSMSYGVNFLPTSNNQGHILSFCNGSNQERARLHCQSTGALELTNAADATLVATAGPVLTASTRFHLEMKIDVGTGAFELRVNGATVINATGLTFSNAGNIAQIRFLQGPNSLGTIYTQYMKDLIVCSTAGTRNNGFLGDRRVATLFPNSDTAVAGWTPRPRHKIGTGILDNRANNNSCVTAASASALQLGSGDFTLEAFVRFFALPTGANKAQIIGKWDETNNQRSYQLYLGGPSLEAGNIVFRVSTSGTAGTVQEIISYPWVPELNRWYHAAVVRAAGETMLFIDGVQLGLPIADVNTYFAGTALLSVGAQVDGTGGIANTALTGFFDEVRMSVGVARYTTTFTPTSVPFGRNVTDDPNFASVALLCGFDSGIADESSFARALTARNGAVMTTPDDGTFAYQTINQPTPRDDTFVEAALRAATGILTLSANPSDGETVTVGTKDGTAAAVYTFKNALAAAFQVKIGATAADSLANLVHAINDDTGEGTLYGTGTTANFDVTGVPLPGTQIQVTANTAGTGGNSIASTETLANGSWGAATLQGGANIPGPSEFTFQRPPPFTTVVRSITLVTRNYKTDSGTCTTRTAYVGPNGAALQGTEIPLPTSPSYQEDTFETDPDTGNDLTPSTIIGGRVRLNRTG